jgi:hypothetical protein
LQGNNDASNAVGVHVATGAPVYQCEKTGAFYYLGTCRQYVSSHYVGPLVQQEKKKKAKKPKKHKH